MAEPPGYLIGPKLLQQIQQTVRHYANMYSGGEGGRPRQQAQQRRQAVLQSDLLAAVDTFTDPSTALAEIVRRKANGDLELADEVVTVVNRFENISIDGGTYIKIEWMDGEWQPYAADCGPQSESLSFFQPSASASEPSASAGIGGP